MRGFLSLLVALAVTLPSVAFAQTVCPELTPAQKLVGLLDTPGVLNFLGAIAVVGSVGYILSRLIDFSWMSANAWGLVGCALSVGMVTFSLWAPAMLLTMVPASVVIFVGALVFAPSLAALLSGSEGPPAVFFGMLTLAYGALALWQGDQGIGFLAVLALLSAFGFTAFGGGLSYAIGFDSEDKVPGTTLAATALVGGYAITKMLGVSTSLFSVFESGAFWVGTFVAGIGMLIISSKWYGRGSDDRRRLMYPLKQILAIAVFVAGMYAGVMLNDGSLLYIAAAFSALYIIEKLYELSPENGLAYAVLSGALGVGAITLAYWYSNNLDVVETFIASIRT